jgi:hypothetical protein
VPTTKTNRKRLYRAGLDRHMQLMNVRVTAEFAREYTPGHVANDTKQLATKARKKAAKEARRASRYTFRSLSSVVLDVQTRDPCL